MLTNALKLHLRVFELHRTTLRIVTLRPQTGVRFSSNYFHDTWHILGGPDGAAILGRLLWGLAFQRHPGTVVLIDRDHLVPTPFEADPPDPILLVPDGLTRIDIDLLRALKLRLRRCRGPRTTIRWHTFGMPAALDAVVPNYIHHNRRALHSRERMSRRAGFLCYTAPAVILRDTATSIFHMSASSSGYHPLAEQSGHSSWRTDGEFQVVEQFARDVSAAKVARREILGGSREIASDAERVEIYRRKQEVLRR